MQYEMMTDHVIIKMFRTQNISMTISLKKNVRRFKEYGLESLAKIPQERKWHITEHHLSSDFWNGQRQPNTWMLSGL